MGVTEPKARVAVVRIDGDPLSALRGALDLVGGTRGLNTPDRHVTIKVGVFDHLRILLTLPGGSSARRFHSARHDRRENPSYSIRSGSRSTHERIHSRSPTGTYSSHQVMPASARERI